MNELQRFHRLAHLTVIATFLLVVVGGVVRVSDSGLGCGKGGSGTEGWPLCGGRVVPLIQQHAVVEFSHRLLAAIVVVLIGLMVWRSIRGLKSHPWLVRGAIAAAALVLVQAGLGGLTVEKNLKDVLVAAHLGTAMVLLGLLIALSAASRERSPERPAVASTAPSKGLVRLAAVCCVLVVATIIAGGYIAGTEEEGVEGGVGGGAHLACGDQFPKCNGKVFPFGSNHLVDVQLVHRGLMFLTVIAILALIVAALRQGVRSWLLGVLGGVVAAQVLLGAINVWTGKHPGLIVAHLTLGTLLWVTMLVTTLQLAAASARQPSPARGRDPEQAPAPA